VTKNILQKGIRCDTVINILIMLIFYQEGNILPGSPHPGRGGSSLLFNNGFSGEKIGGN
jgi:hypothetical protein